jgi:hypothetical protein
MRYAQAPSRLRLGKRRYDIGNREVMCRVSLLQAAFAKSNVTALAGGRWSFSGEALSILVMCDLYFLKS